jgi:hypothetical protein
MNGTTLTLCMSICLCVYIFSRSCSLSKTPQKNPSTNNLARSPKHTHTHTPSFDPSPVIVIGVPAPRAPWKNDRRYPRPTDTTTHATQTRPSILVVVSTLLCCGSRTGLAWNPTGESRVPARCSGRRSVHDGSGKGHAAARVR